MYLHNFAIAKPDGPDQRVKPGAGLKSTISYLCYAFQYFTPLSMECIKMHGEAEMDA